MMHPMQNTHAAKRIKTGENSVDVRDIVTAQREVLLQERLAVLVRIALVRRPIGVGVPYLAACGIKESDFIWTRSLFSAHSQLKAWNSSEETGEYRK